MSDTTPVAKRDLSQGVDLADLPEGRILGGTFRGEAIILAHSDGHFYALAATCSHLGAPLSEGIVTEGRVHCPWHHARFSLASGEAIAAPALLPVGCFRTSVRGDKVYVTERAAQPRPTARGTGQRVVVVGAGAGGYACAQWLARQGHQGRITLISNDPDAPYERTMCSKQYLIGQSSRDETRFRDVPTVIRRLEGEVTALDTQARELTVRGERVPFDVLVLATGAQPIRPSLPGFDRPNVFVLRTMRDADAIIGAAKGSTRVAVLGASFIGLEVAASLRQRHLEVDVIDPGEVPLERVMGRDIGLMVRRVHEEQGVRFHLGRHARHFDGNRLHLDHGGSMAVDFVVLGVGVVPNTQIAEAAGLRCAPKPGGGVLVDARLETSVPGIFAVGDIAAYPDAHCARTQRIEHWVHAQRQGQYVARVILGHEERFEDVPFFWSAHFDTGLTYEGHVSHILSAEQEGSIEGRDFTLRLTGPGREKALIACNRDLPSLLVEAHWDRELTSVN